jgi:FixJ family two-component response regulator
MTFFESSLSQGIVYIQKDSPAEREAIGQVLAKAALETKSVGSPLEMLRQLDGARPACLISDLPTMPGLSRQQFDGLPVEWLAAPVEPGQALEDSHTLVICAACLTEMGCTFRHENLSFLKRPYTRAQLLEATLDALACDLAHHEKSRQYAQAMERIGTLTGREHQVMDLIYEGLPNKTIAGHLSLSTRTVEASRAAVYRKLNVDSGIALVRLLARMEYEVNSRDDFPSRSEGKA